MTEPDRDDRPVPEEVEFRLESALGAFKPRREGADDNLVSERGRSGLTWNPVTETGDSGETDIGPRSTFQFDLGSALARLGGAAEPSVDDGATPGASALTAPGPDTDAGLESAAAPTTAPTTAPDLEHGDESSPSPARAGAELEPLPVRGRPEVVSEPLPVRGRAESSEPEPLPVRGRADSSEPEPSPPRAGADTVQPDPVVDRLPTRTPRETRPETTRPETTRPETTRPGSPRSQPILPTHIDPRAAQAERAAARASSARSVFDDANPTPTLPAVGRPLLPSQPPSAPSFPTPPPGDGALVPILPATVPSAPPPVVAPIESAPSTPELNALRSAQLRANRNDRRGKLFGRSLLAVVVVGGLVAGALLFGRSYLFPTEWDPELTPLVDEVQSARDAEFDHTVPLVERPASEYAPLVTAHVLGADWNTRLPEWRALGLASGDGAVADVQVRVASLYPAFFDADADEIVVSADRSAESREPALRVALETVLASQLAGEQAVAATPLGLTGLDPIEATARRAADAAAAGLAAAAPDALADLAGVPVPVAYQLRAVDSIGTALIDDAARPGDPLPPEAARLDDGASLAVGGLRQPGDQQVLEPVALGADDWALIWGTRLSPAAVGPMADSLVADSYSVVSRSGVTCFVAVFETRDAVAGASLLGSLTTWAGAAPVSAPATATQLAPNRVQLEACDPGADAPGTSAVGAVDLVLRRQGDRLVAD